MKEKWLAEAFLQKAKSGDDARPSPAPVSHLEHVDLENVAGLGALDIDRAGERVDPPAVNGEEFGKRHLGMHLRAA